MKNYIKLCLLTLFILSTSALCAQDSNNKRLAIKLHANVGLGNSIKTKFSLPDVSQKSSSNEFGVDLGWTFWQRKNNRFELNAGLGYSLSSLTLGMEKLSYNYSAPATADMDGNEYLRFYNLSDIEQKTQLGRITVPIYLSYAYQFNRRFALHADLGMSIGFKISSRLSNFSGKGTSYGVYPQYDNLKIEEDYLNNFGSKTYTAANVGTPQTNGFSCNFLGGFGAEVKISDPISIDLSLRYQGGLTNQYQPVISQFDGFTDMNSPVTYSVKTGEQIRPLTDYMKESKLSQIGINIAVIFRLK